MRKYIHFLGYSASEGGVQEIFESSDFDLGEIDLVTMERDFDGFEFLLPELSILKYFPIFDNAPYNLRTDITSNDIDMKIVGLTALSVDDLLWIENERVKILSVLGTDYYRVERGINGSIPIARLYSEFIPEIQTTICQIQRIMPIGLIVKVYDNNNFTLAYGQVETVEILTNGAYRVGCKNLLSQLENSFVSKYDAMTLPFALGLEIFKLFDVPPELSNVLFFGETVENYPNYNIFEDFLKLLYQSCVFTNQIIVFNKLSGRYSFKYLGRIKSGQPPASVKVLDYINLNGGSLKTEMTQRYFSATLKMNINAEETTFTVVDYQFQSGFMGSKKIEIEKDDKLQFSGMDINSLQHQIRKKLFFLNSSYEKLTFSADKLKPYFQVGDYYKILDIHKVKMFTDATKNNVFLCVKNSDGEVSLLRQEGYEVAQVAPAVPIRRTSIAKTYSIDAISTGYTSYDNVIGDFLKTDYSDDGYLYNIYAGTVMFDVGDIVKIIESDGDVTENEITAVGIMAGRPTFTFDTEITTVAGKTFIMTIREGYNLAAKNNVYLYENNGRV